MASSLNSLKAVLVTLADRHYVAAAKALFASAHLNGGWTGSYLLLAHGLSDEEIAWFTSRGILVKKTEAFFDHPIGGMSETLTCKFHLFSEDFRQWDRVVYIDGDSLVLRNLAGLLECDDFSAVTDSGSPLFWQVKNPERIVDTAQRKMAEAEFEEFLKNYNLSELTFCAGFFVFNPKKLDSNTLEKMMDLCRRFNRLSNFGEQLMFNILFYRQWRELPRLYNVQPQLNSGSYWWKNVHALPAMIIHYIGPTKPWKLPWSRAFKVWNEYLLKSEKIDFKNPVAMKAISLAEARADFLSLEPERARRIDRFQRRTKVKNVLTASQVRKDLAKDINGPSDMTYFVATTQRTGSNYLCGLLRSSGIAGMRGPDLEMLQSLTNARSENADLEEDHLANLIEASLKNTATPNGMRGFKIMWSNLAHFNDYPPIKSLAQLPKGPERFAKVAKSFPKAKYVFLYRKNLVRQAISAVKLNESGVSKPEELEGQPPNYQYSYAMIERKLGTLESWNSQWEAFFKVTNTTPFRLSYEALCRSPRRTINQILKFLEIHDVCLNTPQTTVQPMPQLHSLLWEWRFRSERLYKKWFKAKSKPNVELEIKNASN